MRPITILGTSVSVATGLAVGVAVFWMHGDWTVNPDERLLLSALREIGDKYVEERPRSELVDDAIRGVISGLDDHSVYLGKRDLLSLQEQTSGTFGGIGIELGMEDGFVTVVKPLEDAPAAKAGIVAGDRIVEVDHQSMRGRTLRQAVRRLRGEPGSEVHLRVRRADAEQPLDFDLTRSDISLSSVRQRTLAPGYGYLRIARFNDNTADELAAAVGELHADDPLLGLVVDLRNNPGGLLNASVAVADAFLDEGLIVSTRGRANAVAIRAEASAGDLLDGAPVAVLVNGGSASAAEVVAGALKDHGRATLFGSTTFGKGTVQSVMYLQKRRAIKLTTAEYFTPGGQSLRSNGVAPDVAVEADKNESRTAYEQRLLAEALAWLRQQNETAAAPQTGVGRSG